MYPLGNGFIFLFAQMQMEILFLRKIKQFELDITYLKAFDKTGNIIIQVHKEKVGNYFGNI